MQLTRLVLTSATITLGLTLACSDGRSPATPSPSGSAPGDLGPGGSTLKIDPPALQSPAGGSQVQGNAVLVFSNVTGKYASFPVTYDLELRNAQGALVANPRPAASAGGTTSVTITQTLDFDATYNWRVRATYNGAFGPWSETRTFRTMPAGYINGNEIFDPLTNGRTVGVPVGSVSFLPGVGIRLNAQASHVRYELPQNLQEGEFSLLATGVDEGSPGDKSKIMSMAEGDGDITTNDYRMTVEMRGRNYGTPGAVTFRIITGGGEGTIFDGVRTPVGFTDSEWYFWKFTWRTGNATLEVREGGETGSLIYRSSIGTGSRPYRPVPHWVFIGAPVGRAGDLDASVGGLIVKNLWLSGRPRPQFPIFASPAGGQ